MNYGKNAYRFLQIAALLCFSSISNAQLVTTIAGAAGIAGFSDGTGASSRFNSPFGVACDKFGNIYIADRLNNSIRKTDVSGISGTIAGNGTIGGTDGNGSGATFYEPRAIACDTAGN